MAGKSNAHPSHVSRAEKRDDISVLKAGIVYGANASGKSNVIKAIALLQQIANGSFPQSKVEPFKLADTEEKNSKVEIEFKTKGKCFAYGMEFTVGGIKEEWLFEINSRTDKEVFTRKVTDDGNEFTFGKVDGNEETSMLLKFIAHSTPSDSSFLSEYVRRNGKGLETIRMVKNWFADGLRSSSQAHDCREFLFLLKTMMSCRKRLARFLPTSTRAFQTCACAKSRKRM